MGKTKNKIKYTFNLYVYIHERVVIFFRHRRAAFRMRRSLYNVLSYDKISQCFMLLDKGSFM